MAEARSHEIHQAFKEMDPKEKKERIVSLASWAALRWGVGAGAVGAAAVYAATRNSTKFASRTSASAKVALAITPAIFCASLVSEFTLSGAKKDPAAYGIFPKGMAPSAPAAATYSSLMPWHHAANYLYEHPFQMVAGLGIPSVVLIARGQNSEAHKALKLSQKIMGTRLYGQTTVLLILLSSMAFHDFMRRRGGTFKTEEEERVEVMKKLRTMTR